MIRVTVDSRQVSKMLSGFERQLPFALSVAVDRTARDAQRIMQDSLAGRFVLRRAAFMERTIKMLQFARKGDPVAIVGVDPQRDLLAKFEEGGTKRPLRGRSVAVPKEVRGNIRRVIGAKDRPAALRGTGTVILPLRTGSRGLFKRLQRRGRKSMRGPGYDPRLKLLYVLRPSVPIRPVLRLRSTIAASVQQRWPVNAIAAVERALRTAR